MADFFSNLLAPFGTGAQEKASQDQIAALQQAMAAYQQMAQQGRTDLTTNITAGLQPTLQNVQSGQAGINQYLAALGIVPPQSAGFTGPPGTPGGAAPDMSAVFAATPGYQFARDQGLEAVLRKQAASGALGPGGLASGNTNQDLINYAGGIASQNYNNYLQGLQPFISLGQNSAQNALQGYTNLGTGLSNIDIGQANAAYGNLVGQGNAQANADLAPLQAGANIWGALGGLAKLASGGLGGLGGGGIGGGGSLFGNFGVGNLGR
jgi:hypothetical protein